MALAIALSALYPASPQKDTILKGRKTDTKPPDRTLIEHYLEPLSEYVVRRPTTRTTDRMATMSHQREVIAEGSEEARGPIYEERSVLKKHVGGYGDFWRCGRCLDICPEDFFSARRTGLAKGMEKYALAGAEAPGLSAIQLFVINEHMRSVQQRYEDVKRGGGTRNFGRRYD